MGIGAFALSVKKYFTYSMSCQYCVLLYHDNDIVCYEDVLFVFQVEDWRQLNQQVKMMPGWFPDFIFFSSSNFKLAIEPVNIPEQATTCA